MECAAACSLLNEAALTRSSSCLLRSSENPACSMLRCAERPPSSIASSVIWDRRRAMAPFISSSSSDPLVWPCSFAFVAESSAFCCRWQAAENRLDAGAAAVLERRIEARRICEVQSCLPVMSCRILQQRFPRSNNKDQKALDQTKIKLKKWQPQECPDNPDKKTLSHPPPRSSTSRDFRLAHLLRAGANSLLSTQSLAVQFHLH